ncbi:hypothetical protein F0562_021114 [Nyssa sinensis]|uniref:Large ribosomal subunit protein eL14 domain-containing protein n=1 Tax=Nyssa sinensis TaxID=561372 RepID=A0A5J5BQC6_9ASTE|nr:hypothetical protein F0562_021114 [Nyssa sinensis]
MPFKRFVEIGRVALINYGKDYGKLVVIVDVIDQNRALVDSPDMVRTQMNFKRLSLTDIKIDIKRVPKKKTLIAAMEAADVKNKWDNSSWGRKLIVQKRRASLNDFDRFKIILAKIKEEKDLVGRDGKFSRCFVFCGPAWRPPFLDFAACHCELRLLDNFLFN